VRRLRPAAREAAHPMVRQAPPGKPATAIMDRRDGQPGNRLNGIGARPDYERSNPVRSGQPVSTPTSQPSNHPANLAPSQPAATSVQVGPIPHTRIGRSSPNQPKCSAGTTRLHVAEQPAGESSDDHPANQPAPNEHPGGAQSRTAESATLQPSESAGVVTAKQSPRREFADQPPWGKSSACGKAESAGANQLPRDESLAHSANEKPAESAEQSV